MLTFTKQCAVAMLLLATVACDDDKKTKLAGSSTGDEQLASSFVARLRECGILGEGRYDDDTIVDEFDRCAARCSRASTRA